MVLNNNFNDIGFYGKDHYLVSNTLQYDLNTMARLPQDDCILISDIKKDSVQAETELCHA